MQLPKDVKDALDEKVFAHLGTVNPDGSPQVSVVWVGRDGDTVLVSTASGRVKSRNIEGDPRVAISISPPSEPYKNIVMQGTVTRSEQSGRWLIDALNDKYVGDPVYPLPEGQIRVNYEIAIKSIGSWG